MKYYRCIRKNSMLKNNDIGIHRGGSYTLIGYEIGDILRCDVKHQKRYYEINSNNYNAIIDHGSVSFFEFFEDITKEYLRDKKLKEIL